MLNDLKALLVVLGIAVPVFALLKPVCLRFMSVEAFKLRRNGWMLLTAAAFMSPSFWVFALIAGPVYAWLGAKDSNPVALYLFLAHVIPPYPFSIPIVGINQLFELTNFRLLALAVFVPWLWRNPRSSEPGANQITAIGCCLLAYWAIKLLPMVPYESPTSTVRRAFLFFLDTAVLYYLASRACASKAKIVEVMATFGLMCAL